MKMLNWLVWGLIIIILIILLLTAGCHCNKSKMFITYEPNDPNCSTVPTSIVLEGKPAEIVSEVMAINFQNVKGRENVLFDSIVKVAAPLLLLFVGGLIFWGITRSKWGWVIPAASAGGLGLIVVFIQAARYIIWGMVGIAFLVIIYKAYEYQKERNILSSLNLIKK